MLVPGKYFQPSLMYAGKAGTFLSEATAKFLGRLLALSTNISLVWKGLSGKTL
jgi:hypothetical protein